MKKLKLEGRLPMNVDRDLRFALDQIFREIGISINSTIDQGLTTKTVVIDTATTGVVLKDTQGTPHYWGVTVDTAGSLVTTDLGTTRPNA
jgi:hypothetical protein